MILWRGRQIRPGPKRAKPQSFLVSAFCPDSGLARARAHGLLRACGLLHLALSRLLRWRRYGRGRGTVVAERAILRRFLRLDLRSLRGRYSHDGLLFGRDLQRALCHVLPAAFGLGAARLVAGGARGPRRRLFLLRPGDAARSSGGRDGAGDSLAGLLQARRRRPEWTFLDLCSKERTPCRPRRGLRDRRGRVPTSRTGRGGTRGAQGGPRRRYTRRPRRRHGGHGPPSRTGVVAYRRTRAARRGQPLRGGPERRRRRGGGERSAARPGRGEHPRRQGHQGGGGHLSTRRPFPRRPPDLRRSGARGRFRGRVIKRHSPRWGARGQGRTLRLTPPLVSTPAAQACQHAPFGRLSVFQLIVSERCRPRQIRLPPTAIVLA